MRRICIIAVVAATLAGTSAFADARQHFMAGQDYYSQGRYQKAAEEFDEAYRLDPRPLLLFNIAQAWEKLGELEKAVEFFKRFLEADPKNEDRETLLARIATLEERIAETGITIQCEETGAAVYVDNKQVGTTPVDGKLKLSAGTHKVQVSKTGFEDFKMTVVVASGKAIPVEVTLEPGQAGPAPTVAAKGEEKPAGAPGEEKKPGDGKKKVEALDIVPWAIAGVGVVAVGVGWGALGSVAKNKQPSDPDADPAAQDDAHKMAIIADAVGIAGAVIAAAGATWGVIRIVKKKGESAEPAAGASVSFAPIIGDGTGGVFADVRF